MPPTPDPSVLRTFAPAKINWTLEVLGKRPDGYHEIRSVMQTISLSDEVEMRPAGAFSLAIWGDEAGGLTARDNLVTRAVRSFPDRDRTHPVSVRLRKSIPAAAGLGGGSSDAAAALRILAKHWSLTERSAIGEAAAALGSDVPFFLRGGMQLAHGRGEAVTPLPIPGFVDLVLITPPIAVPDKTRRLYSLLRPKHYTEGEHTSRLIESLKQGRTPTDADFFNVFDLVADAVFPELRRYRELLEHVAGGRALLAGAGPSLFVLLPSGRGWREEMVLAQAMERRGLRGWFVRTTGAISARRPPYFSRIGRAAFQR
jgi:4-diphosphocytidyl-2-C-methyl-D-erythritol kinase